MRLRIGLEGVTARLRLSTSAACAGALGRCLISTAARPEIGIAGASDADWSVLTIAPDGAWGTATEASVSWAIATAVERCRATLRSALGCGAYQVSVQRRWSLGLRCGRDNILRTGTTLAEATESGGSASLSYANSISLKWGVADRSSSWRPTGPSRCRSLQRLSPV